MANCFDFRMRTSSFDLHQLAQRRKLRKISNLFRSRSEGNVKSSPKTSPKQSPKGSPTVVRRRFVRVVKDNEAAGEEYENPHIIRRYTQEYLQEQYAQRSPHDSFDEDNLPYIVSGHTILKKPGSLDRTESPTGDQSPQAKHASFKEEVEIIEFDKKGKVKACSLCTHVEKLQDSDEEENSSDICDSCAKKGREDCPHSSESESDDNSTEAKDSLDSEITVSDTQIIITDTTVDIKSTVSNMLHHKEDATDSIVSKLVSTHISLSSETERSRGIMLVADS